MMLIQRSKLTIILLCLLLTQGFACKGVGNLSKQQQAELIFNQTLASIATTNLVVTNAVIAANRVDLLNVVMTRKILAYNKYVAETGQKVLAITGPGRTWPDRSKEALALLRTISLPPDIKEFINRPHADAAVIAAVQAIVLIDGLVRTATAVAAAEGGK